jgi:hypothetical protein
VSVALSAKTAIKTAAKATENHFGKSSQLLPEVEVGDGQIHIAVQQNPFVPGAKVVRATAAPLPVFAQYGRLIA